MQRFNQVVVNHNSGEASRLYKGVYYDIYIFSHCLGAVVGGGFGKSSATYYVLSPDSEIRVLNGVTQEQIAAVRVGTKFTARSDGYLGGVSFGSSYLKCYIMTNDNFCASAAILEDVGYAGSSGAYYGDCELDEYDAHCIFFIFAESVERASEILAQTGAPEAGQAY